VTRNKLKVLQFLRGFFIFLYFRLYTKNALSDLHRRIAQATIQNTNTTKRDFVLKIKAFKDTNNISSVPHACLIF
ncbi:hypothetical protein, partial [Phocaeicola plebeius]|uniref:hypothetical protein n=1 Tax=Phocaeicola plebeius TaxID=310297 RepID=UPI00356766A3